MAHWVKLDDLGSAPPVGRGWPYETEAGDVALFNVDGVFYAIAGDCPHQGAPLGMGQLTGTVVICPGHGLRYDVITGLKPGANTGVRTYPTEMRDDGIYVDVDVSAV
jgi:nitrite reductase/ring-hydroxylating ferredoxin subunit